MRTLTENEIAKIIKENNKYNKDNFGATSINRYDHQMLKRKHAAQLDHIDFRNIDPSVISRHIADDYPIDDLLQCYINTFIGCNFEGSILSGLNCSGYNFSFCNFKNADLRNCNFQNCKFMSADMRNALVDDANFKNADLSRTINPPDLPMACPKEGEFIAYKYALDIGNDFDILIIKLLIPAHAKRSSATTSKCRASEATVLEITHSSIASFKLLNYNTFDKAKSVVDPNFIYTIGRTVRPRNPFDENRYNECASGIHFYMTFKEADTYINDTSIRMLLSHYIGHKKQ